MTTPFPGFTAPAPRTWAKKDIISVPRLRGDMTNLAALFAGGARPMLLSVNESSPFPSSGSATLLALGGIIPLNTWNVTVINLAGTNPYYQIPLAGWYLVQGSITSDLTSTTPSIFKYATGFDAVVNGAGAANTDGGAVSASTSTAVQAGAAACELYQLNTFANTADTLAMYVTNTSSAPGAVLTANLMIEWVALPTSGLTSYTGPYGTVVTTPAAAASFPSGPGTTITNGGGISAGATSVTVSDATGMITGGTLGLDFTAGQLFQPVAEPVTITSVAGTTIGISATNYAHLQNAPVAVPVSAAFLNQQCRDIVNFLAYPPMVRAAPQSNQSIPSTTFPTGTQITGLTATLDNFTGFASNAYTAPVAGVYFVYGQVYYVGSTATTSYCAGVQVAAGTIQWGNLFRASTAGGAVSYCATVRRMLRLTAGQTIKLYGFQNSGSAMNTEAAGATFSKLICVWRAD